MCARRAVHTRQCHFFLDPFLALPLKLLPLLPLLYSGCDGCCTGLWCVLEAPHMYVSAVSALMRPVPVPDAMLAALRTMVVPR